MGLLSGLAKAGLAKKAYNEVRKPQNQARLKSLFQKATSSRSGGRPAAGRQAPRR